jgi:hypothetical protein
MQTAYRHALEEGLAFTYEIPTMIFRTGRSINALALPFLEEGRPLSHQIEILL